MLTFGALGIKCEHDPQAPTVLAGTGRGQCRTSFNQTSRQRSTPEVVEDFNSRRTVQVHRLVL
jgi:hypothetical protein